MLIGINGGYFSGNLPGMFFLMMRPAILCYILCSPGLECLVQLSADLGLKKENEEYTKELKKAHKSNELKEQVINSQIIS